MADERPLITAAELDAMTPDERAACFDACLVTDFDQLPPDFRARVVATAERLGRERRTAPAE